MHVPVVTVSSGRTSLSGECRECYIACNQHCSAFLISCIVSVVAYCFSIQLFLSLGSGQQDCYPVQISRSVPECLRGNCRNWECI